MLQNIKNGRLCRILTYFFYFRSIKTDEDGEVSYIRFGRNPVEYDQ